MSAKVCPQCSAEYEAEQRFCPKDGATLKPKSAAAGDLIGSIIADRYHVISKLGEGGMGQVYLAEHVRMGRRSAVKIMHPAMVHDADAISRFNREAANASRITHPHVAAIYDFGETPEGLIYLAMEFVEGEPLTAVIEREGALPPRRVATLVRQAADALAAAHAQGIVHRDLKPDNIMVARNRDGSDCVKIVDFGIAKAANNEAQKVTRTGLVVGTPEYMSPEQLAGDPLDGRSDIYSLALVAFTSLTGRLPFPSETSQESMIMRLTDRPRSLAEMKPGIAWPARLQAVMDRALAREASGRYADAAEMGRAFMAAIEDMPDAALAEASTSIMAAPLPATRVAPAPTLVTGATATRPRRPRWPLVAGGAAVVLGAVVALGILARDEGGAAQRDTVPRDRAALAAANDGPTTTVPAATATETRAQTSDPAPAPTERTGTTPPRTGGGGLSPEGARQEILALRELALSEPDAAVRRAATLLPRLTNRADSIEARFYRYQALGNQDMQTACNGFRQLLPDATGRIHDEIESAWTVACKQ
ncbi:MAG TPA: serine/threonine-protein kinase [Gemmatimonadaceae bacterium]|nr:serine/threonine-protein kinase [Gemmatimonadaceae bacterium]